MSTEQPDPLSLSEDCVEAAEGCEEQWVIRATG